MSNFSFNSSLDSLLIKEGIKGVENLLGTRFETVVKLVGHPSCHPLNGFRVNREMLRHSEETVMALRKTIQVLKKLMPKNNELSHTKELYELLLRDNSVTIFNEDAEELRLSWRAIKTKWFIPRFFAKRSFLSRLRRFNHCIMEQEVDSLINQLSIYRKQHEEIEQIREILKQYFDIEIPADEMPETVSSKQP